MEARGIWRTHLLCCAVLMMVLMLVIDVLGWLLTFGKKDGHKLIEMLQECPFRERPVIKYLGPFTTPDLISCPTCGRCDVGEHFLDLAQQVEEALQKVRRPIKVAVMGCEVNGPGEAKQADVGIAFGKGRGALFKKGQIVRTMPWDECIPALLEEIERTW